MILRGANKRVVEVTATENEYFERIIFFVKSEKNGVSEHFLKKQAADYIQSENILRPGRRKKKAVRVACQVAKYAGVAGVGATLTAVIMGLF